MCWKILWYLCWIILLLGLSWIHEWVIVKFIIIHIVNMFKYYQSIQLQYIHIILHSNFMYSSNFIVDRLTRIDQLLKMISILLIKYFINNSQHPFPTILRTFQSLYQYFIQLKVITLKFLRFIILLNNLFMPIFFYIPYFLRINLSLFLITNSHIQMRINNLIYPQYIFSNSNKW